MENWWQSYHPRAWDAQKLCELWRPRYFTLISATPLVPRRCSTSQSNLLMKSLASFVSFASSGNFRWVLQLTIYHQTQSLSFTCLCPTLELHFCEHQCSYLLGQTDTILVLWSRNLPDRSGLCRTISTMYQCPSNSLNKQGHIIDCSSGHTSVTLQGATKVHVTQKVSDHRLHLCHEWPQLAMSQVITFCVLLIFNFIMNSSDGLPWLPIAFISSASRGG